MLLKHSGEAPAIILAEQSYPALSLERIWHGALFS
jgi:hypothetical protein